jgi:Kelch motif protein/galactose oxidase-like protein
MRRCSVLVVLVACGAPQPFEPAPEVSEMTSPRGDHSMTLLPSGKVLVAGGFGSVVQGDYGVYTESAELYDPATGSWTPTGPRSDIWDTWMPVLLPSGKVLLAGGLFWSWRYGTACQVVRTSAWLYDPATGTVTATGPMATPRSGGAMLLVTGDVLAFGGYDDYPDNCRGRVSKSAELYHPETGTWTRTGDMVTARDAEVAAVARLASGDVLVVGGATAGVLKDEDCYFPATVDAEIYSPATGTWAPTQPLDYAVVFAQMTLLPSGDVLLVGGCASGCVCDPNRRARIYDPRAGTWRATSPTHWPRSTPAAVGLPSGKVLVVGGTANQPEGTFFADLFDPATETWSSLKLLQHNHGNVARAVLLPAGDVLITGGGWFPSSKAPLIGNPGPASDFLGWRITDIAERFHAPD